LRIEFQPVSACTDYFGRKGKAFCEGLFALHRQKPEKDKKNFDVASPTQKIYANARGCTDFDQIIGS